MEISIKNTGCETRSPEQFSSKFCTWHPQTANRYVLGGSQVCRLQSQMMRLEAIVNIKQSTGYNGNLCSNASREYVRFYVDFKDGGGFNDMGLASFKSADISDLPPGPQHPLSYMVYLYINDEQYRRFTDCTHAVIPTMRAILQWNLAPPPATPGYQPFYGNVRDVDIQLQRRPWIIFSELGDVAKKIGLSSLFAAEHPIPLPDPGPVKA